MTKLLIKMFLGDKSPAASPSVRRAYGKLAGAVGIFMNFLLFSVKLLAGIISGSVSILADAFNNLSDIGSSAVSLLGFKLAGKPADPEHPYGHGRMEYMAGFIVAVLIILVGFELLRSSVGKIIAGGGSSVSPWMFAVLFVSALLKLWLFFFNRSLSKKIGAGLLMAAARDSMGDVLATSAVLACAGAEYFWSIHIDGYIGALVALFIVYSGFDTARDTVDQLLGKAPGDEIVGKLRALVLKYEEFSGLH
ncbi:MAG TPA: cation-efflux pump, partial [Ruminococcaceae bacterium]|nr:cation-efflux pump [Oscillospiraceae bacterium]